MAATQELPRTASQFPLGPYGNAFRRQLSDRLRITPPGQANEYYDLVEGDLGMLFDESVAAIASNGPFNVPIIGEVSITSLTAKFAERKSRREKKLTLKVEGIVVRGGKESKMSVTLANAPSGRGLVLAERDAPFPVSKAIDLYVRTKKPNVTELITSPLQEHFTPKEWLVDDIQLGEADGNNVLHTVFRRDPSYLALPQ